MPLSFALTRGEFPQFPIASLPSFLFAAEWKDASFRHDVCPSYVRQLTDSTGIRVMVDHPDAEQREESSYPRFGVYIMGVDDGIPLFECETESELVAHLTTNYP